MITEFVPSAVAQTLQLKFHIYIIQVCSYLPPVPTNFLIGLYLYVVATSSDLTFTI